MLSIIKHFITSSSTALSLSKKQGFLNFFNIFNIRFLYAFSLIRNNFNKTKKNDKKNINSSEDHFTTSIGSEKIIDDLSSIGYNDKLEIKPDLMKKIISEINLKNSTIYLKGEKKVKDFIKNATIEDDLNSILMKSKKNHLSHVVLEIDIKKTNYIKDLADSEFFLNIARNYIGGKNISIVSQCYISNPINIQEIEKKNNAQYFHYDLDYKKFFKVFIYLNNVDSNNGPHQFVVSTNLNKKFKHIVAERIDDIEIKKNYEKIKIFEGNSGQVIIEDTFGLHKGEWPKKNSRLMLVLIYGHEMGLNNFKYPILKKMN